jgi:hypothetical protein
MRTLAWASLGVLLGAVLGAGGCTAVYALDTQSELHAYVPLGVYVLCGALFWSLVGGFLGAGVAVATSAGQDQPPDAT